MIVARDSALDQDWWHTAAMMSQFYNAHRGKNDPQKGPEKFHPFAKPTPVKARQATEEDLRILFGG